MTKSIIYSVIGLCIVTIATIITILYANGYNYNFVTKAIEKTGVIKVSTTPSSSIVYVNGVNEGQSPVSVFNLPEGEYIVKVTKSGYTDWTSMVDVTGGKISLVYPILYPSTINARQAETTTSSISQVFFGKGIYAYTTNNKTNTGQDIYIHNFGSSFLDIGEATKLVLDTNSLSLDNTYSTSTITFQPNGTRFILRMSSNKAEPDQYYLINISNSTSPIRLNDLIDTNLYTTVLPGEDDTHLIIENSTTIVNLDATTGQKIILVQTDAKNQIITTSINNSTLYYELLVNDKKKEYSLNSIQIDGTNNTIITLQDAPMQQVISTNTDYAYDIQGQGIYIYYPELYNNLLQITTNNGNITPISFSPDTKYLLYKDSNNNLYTYSIETKESSALNLNLKDVNSILWDKNSRVLIYSSANTTLPNYFQISGINYDGSNNDILYKGMVANPLFTLSPTDGRILFEMDSTNQSKDIQTGIYDIIIQGI